jgi:hypothetical protein
MAWWTPGAVNAAPGQHLALTAVVVPDAKAAAQIYPANYWLSLLQVPPKSAFPMTVTIPSNEDFRRSYDDGGPDRRQRMGTRSIVVQNQANWVATVKDCEICHQLGTKFTREINPQMGAFDSSAEAWDHRVRMGQVGNDMLGMINPIGRQQAERRSWRLDGSNREGRGAGSASASGGRREKFGDNHVGYGKAHLVFP